MNNNNNILQIARHNISADTEIAELDSIYRTCLQSTIPLLIEDQEGDIADIYFNNQRSCVGGIIVLNHSRFRDITRVESLLDYGVRRVLENGGLLGPRLIGRIPVLGLGVWVQEVEGEQ